MSFRRHVTQEGAGRGRWKVSVVERKERDPGAGDPASGPQTAGNVQASRASWGINQTQQQHSRFPRRLAAVAARCPDGSAPRLLDQKEKATSVLPQIKNGRGRAPGERGRTIDPPRQPIPKQEPRRPQPFKVGDVTPWVRPSPSETSLTAFLFSIPSHKPCCEDLLAPLQSPGSIQPVLRQRPGNSPTPPPANPPSMRAKSSFRVKERSRAGISKRRSLHKLYSVKLPPVPPVTELSFSRNFSFSFFELPEHQGPQQWLQRQRLVHVMMSELHRAR